MKIINVKIKKMKVSSFSARDYSVELAIDFNDGADKQIMRHTVIDYPEMVAEHIFNDLKKMEKNINIKFDGTSVLDSYVNVVMQNEDEDKKKVAKFLQNVSEKINKIKNKRVVEGYINLIKEINLMKVEL
ncbi:hypothetical protein COV14_06120 [Candidatus Woesearchaeota archaeon CG10_big_fil_rev_8_21_14_0_10_33_12]|nr:MAG: hypothetical protein COV14_06120 [Candidatus Woesearchaeota archaeon CG10_big_fil_rev_8_21_14_0_10_33_12]